MPRLEKTRLLRLLGTHAFLGLAICVFAWGLQYKLSLYETHRVASHRVPRAKLLSEDEQRGAVEIPLIIRMKAPAKAISMAPTSVFMVLLLAIGLLNPPARGRVAKQTVRLLHLRRAALNTLFIRPPPVPA